MLITYAVRLAERSKALDLSSGSRKRAWVRIPHLTNPLFVYFQNLKVYNTLNVNSPFRQTF
jgi:hypothetical protein